MRLDVLNEINLITRGGECVVMCKSKMAEIMNCDPRTVKKYLEGYVPKRRKSIKRASKLDEFKETIKEKLELGCSAMSIFKFIQKDGYNG